MKELFGQLAALDPHAGEQLRVIEHFDRLVEANTGVERLLREASVLSQVTIGYHNGRTGLVVLATGESQHLAGTEFEVRGPSTPVGERGVVWLERHGEAHANDAMVLERLALAVGIAEARYADQLRITSAVEVLLCPPLEYQERREASLLACSRLGFDPHEELRAVALPVAFNWSTAWPSALLEAPWGRVRGFIVRGAVTWAHRSGIGVPATAMGLARSWRSALIALRLSDRDEPFSVEDLGALLPLLEGAIGSGADHRDPDVERVQHVLRGAWTLPALQRIADGESLRAVAETAALHHSTIAARIPKLVADLGYDPQTPLGRTRLYVALMSLRLKRGLDEPPH